MIVVAQTSSGEINRAPIAITPRRLSSSWCSLSCGRVDANKSVHAV
jgi:hypothetical protein